MNLKAGLTFAAGLLIAGCGMQPMKPSPGHVQAVAPAPAGDIPEPVRITPILPKPKPTARPETYSVVVNNVKVQELLFALARDAKLNIDIHSGIAGSVTLNAIDQTLQQLLARIAKQVDMRYELDGPNLAVMPDTPFLRIYKIDYLNMDRKTAGVVGASAQVSSAAGGAGGGGGGTNSSTITVTNSSNNTLWTTLEKNIKDILHETDKVIPTTAPRTVAPSTPTAPTTATTATPGTSAPSATPPEPNITFREAAAVIVNPEAGVITIRATSRQHEKIQEFLDQIRSNIKRQVLIEAIVVEVALNNQFQRGIDWSIMRKGTTGISLDQATIGLPTSVNPPLPNIFTINAAAANFGNLSAIIKLLDSFGTVRVLSSPRLSVLNNQTAVLRVVDNLIYFEVKATITPGTTTGAQALRSYETTVKSVPIGFLMNVTPQISDSNTVLLNVKPTITRLLRYIQDPNPDLGSVANLVPQTRMREMESLIKVNNGQIAVLGGLIEDSIDDTENSVPGISRLAFYGSLFGSSSRTNVKTELVVFIRPMIVTDPSIDGDYRSYRTFLPDDNFMSRPNPAKPPLLGDPPGTPR